jgi:hypothetical protein
VNPPRFAKSHPCESKITLGFEKLRTSFLVMMPPPFWHLSRFSWIWILSSS